MKVSELKEKYDDLCQIYAKMFCEKHKLPYKESGWIGDEVGGVLGVNGERFVDFRDMKYDVDNEVKVGMYEDWDDYCDRVRNIEIQYESVFSPKRDEGRLHHINFEGWVAGAPRYSEEELEMKSKQLERLEDMKGKFLSAL